MTMNDDVYNMVLRLYMKWDDGDGVRKTWEEMERNGWGPDRRSYTIMIHENFEKREKPRTEKLVSSMNIRLKGRTEKHEDVEGGRTSL
ncbi:hypothetical protein GYH30_044506 [Glycine max]|uniref:Pentatricopeptide repeat-containing protein n=2 Tax=Glycine subgen. Soja TaxID=1462606 RepID=K7MFY5_SOYBN|nr:hypothetical protein GYH30_044506 [Glycine max]RZB60153.1 putative pentatricopeptide repeat-containing protein [Glycine soja]